MLARAGLVYRTLRHVPLEQLWFYLLRRRLSLRVARPASTRGTNKMALPLTLAAPLPTVEPIVQQGRLYFLNQTAGFELDTPDWRASGMPKLWRYHLHYFDWLKDEIPDHILCAFTLDHWIAHNPPGSEDAWEPYTASLRLINWIGYCFRRCQLGLDIKAAWIDSIAEQGNWLAHNLEFHIRANHLLKNRLALVWFRLLFRVGSGDASLHRACSDLQAELLEQFNADGGHYERSPSYHAICLEHCIALFDALQAAAVSTALLLTLRNVIDKGLRFLQALSFSDGKVALIGDSTLHGAHAWQTLQNYWQQVNLSASIPPTEPASLQHFPNTGFVVWQFGNGKLIVSTGGPSPVYQPGHAHCDAGSFELEWMGRRVIVDSGVSQYAPGPMRHYVRSSRAHNVMAVENQDQNEIWGEFRIGARIEISNVDVRQQSDSVQVVLEMRSHAAARVSYRHRRVFTLQSHQIQISDTVQLNKPALVHSRLHFHPEFQLYQREGVWHLDDDATLSIHVETGESPAAQVEAGHYCPDFGSVLPNQCLLLSMQCQQQGALDVTIRLQPGHTAVSR
jgi:uncharacterized heparinase superfamily protein